QDKWADIRAQAVWLIGINGCKEDRNTVNKALKDEDGLVRRRACEALIRAGMEPAVDEIWPLLNDPDRFVRTAARLVLQRVEPSKWTDRLWKESNNHVFFEGVIALCKTNQAAAYAEPILERLRAMEPGTDVQALLDYLRTVQMALIHTGMPNGENVTAIAARCDRMFSHADWRVNRELAILLAHFGKHGNLKE